MYWRHCNVINDVSKNGIKGVVFILLMLPITYLLE